MNTLSPEAQDVIEKYFNLPIGDGCSTPYFNNRRTRIRGALLALVGKGSPEEIVEEAKMFAIKDRATISKLSPDELKKFLVDHGLGIDCSGFASQILDVELRVRKGKKIAAAVKPYSGWKRKIRHFFRPIGNIGVSTFSHETNSFAVHEKDVQAGDFISIISSEKLLNHMMVVERVVRDGNKITIQYVHSIAYSSDGLYNTGVRRGDIIVERNEKLIDALWSEPALYTAAKNAEEVSLRRLTILK